MNHDEIESQADDDFDRMMERVGGNRRVIMLVGQVSGMIGLMGLTDEEAKLFRDEMTILINRTLGGL